MEKMTFDFAFIENSLLHGEFLCEVHRTSPDTKIEKVTNKHEFRSNTIFLSVTVPDELATVLKLRFGHCIVRRPPPKPKYEDIFKDFAKIKDDWIDYDALYKQKIWNKEYKDYLKICNDGLKKRATLKEQDKIEKYILELDSWANLENKEDNKW